MSNLTTMDQVIRFTYYAAHVGTLVKCMVAAHIVVVLIFRL